MPERAEFPQSAVAQLLGSNGPIHAVSYSASPGTYILTGSSDRSIRLYNPLPPTPSPASSHITRPAASALPALPAGRLIQTYAAHGYEVLSLAVAADNARFASAGGDRAVFLWDVATAQTTRRFGGSQHGHTGRVNCVAFGGADDSLVVSGGLDTTVRVWDARAGGGKPVQVLGEARDAVSAVVVAGAEIVAGSVDGRVRSYDVRMGRATTDVLGASVTSLCLARDAKTVLVGSLDSKVRLMDRANGACLKAYADAGWRNEELRVQSVLGGKERFVVAGDEMTSPAPAAGSGDSVEVPATPSGVANEGRVWAWDLLTGKLVARLSVPWGAGGSESRKRVVGRDGKEKERKNVVSCIAWKEGGFGNQFCVGGTSGAVTVFGKG
ncbi:WD40-repeat-containing domain protein [Lasiosphaeria hispida]|uniref:WD40-repeat-containing domain protein n=1 Tax=Lasiosphaeria hispida TaxID=260671 RepID=A0AAJ0HR10_9PEZI|nr:WD40-repeat-containing domain protein [Lasiosphaeria hispida]